MKKAMIALVALLVFAVGAQAQMPSAPFSLYAGGALSLPNSPDAFKDAYKNGFHGYVGAGQNVMPKMQLVGKIEYNQFSFDFDGTGLATAGVDGGGSQKVWMFGADARYALGLPAAPLKPFFFGGGGMASISTSDFEGSNLSLVTSTNDQLEGQTKMYWNIGAGAEFKTSPMMSLFVQARYVSVMTDGEALNFIPISVGLKFF